MRFLLSSALFVLAASAMAQGADRVEVTPLKDGFVKVTAPGYSFELPKGWTVGNETPWGARDIKGDSRGGKFGTMTADASRATWDSLYEVSLGFILREERGTATPYRKMKTEGGYEAIAFEVMNKNNFAARRYVLLKNSDGRALALSLKIENEKDEAYMAGAFKRMVNTARFSK